jgi:hypothetical protein
MSLQHNRDANQPTNMGIQPAAAPAMPPMMPEAPPSRIIRCSIFWREDTYLHLKVQPTWPVFQDATCTAHSRLSTGGWLLRHLLLPYSMEVAYQPAAAVWAHAFGRPYSWAAAKVTPAPSCWNNAWLSEAACWRRLLWWCSLLEAVTKDELTNDEEYTEIVEDMRDECGKYGQVKFTCAALFIQRALSTCHKSLQAQHTGGAGI